MISYNLTFYTASFATGCKLLSILILMPVTAQFFAKTTIRYEKFNDNDITQACGQSDKQNYFPCEHGLADFSLNFLSPAVPKRTFWDR